MQQIQFYICKLNTCNTPEDTMFPEVLLLGNCKEVVDYMKEYLGNSGLVEPQTLQIQLFWTLRPANIAFLHIHPPPKPSTPHTHTHPPTPRSTPNRQ